MEKLLISIISLVVGWVLAQLTEVVKEKIRTRRLKNALSTEVEDLSEQAKFVSKVCLGALDSLPGKAQGIALPHELETPIFDNYYHLVCSEFSSAERLFIKNLYSHVRQINFSVKEFEETENKRKLLQVYIASLMVIEGAQYSKEQGKFESIPDGHERSMRMKVKANEYLGALQSR